MSAETPHDIHMTARKEHTLVGAGTDFQLPIVSSVRGPLSGKGFVIQSRQGAWSMCWCRDHYHPDSLAPLCSDVPPVQTRIPAVE